MFTFKINSFGAFLKWSIKEVSPLLIDIDSNVNFENSPKTYKKSFNQNLYLFKSIRLGQHFKNGWLIKPKKITIFLLNLN